MAHLIALTGKPLASLFCEENSSGICRWHLCMSGSTLCLVESNQPGLLSDLNEKYTLIH